MSRRDDLTTTGAAFKAFGGIAAALCETAVMTPLTLRLLHARQLHSSLPADNNLHADLMAEAGLIELQHSIHLARQCGKAARKEEAPLRARTGSEAQRQQAMNDDTRAKDRNPLLTMTNVYWNEARQCYALAIVAEGQTRVFDFTSRAQAFRLGAQTMNALAQQDAE